MNHHKIAGHWFIRLVGANNGRWICADILQHAKWIFAKAEGIESISRIQGSRYGPATDTWEAIDDALLNTINAENNGIIDTVREWITVGWECLGEPAPAQIAAAMLIEADGQDSYVTAGEPWPEYPKLLRQLAWMILDHYHPRPINLEKR